jgi:hypothetical protein
MLVLISDKVYFKTGKLPKKVSIYKKHIAIISVCELIVVWQNM